MKALFSIASIKNSYKLAIKVIFISTSLLLAFPALAVTKPPIPPKASLSYKSMVFLRSNPVLSGTANNLKKPLRITITSTSTETEIWSKDIDILTPFWSTVIYPPIAVGNYEINLSSGGLLLDKGFLTIGIKPPLVTLDQTLTPYDVLDGHLIRFSVHAFQPTRIAQFSFKILPIASTIDTVTLYGYKESAYSESIITDTDGTLATTTFDATTSVATLFPSEPILIPEGETYYFDLDGVVTPTDGYYSITTIIPNDPPLDMGITLSQMSDQSGFVWSGGELGTGSTTDAIWFNGSRLPELVYGLTAQRYATPTLSCDLETSTTTIQSSSPVTITWNTSGADKVTWEDGKITTSEGEKTITLSSPHTFVLNLSGALGSMQCSATISYDVPIITPIVQSAPITPPATSTPKGSFTATPTAGRVSLTVSFKGTVNNDKSCSASTYTFGYGDNSTTTISVPTKLCKAQSFNLSHTYRNVGTYTAALYRGNFSKTSSTTLEQTQKITVTKTTAEAASLIANIYLALKNTGSSIISWLKYLNSPHETEDGNSLELQAAAVIEQSFQDEPEEVPAPGAIKIPIFIYHSIRPSYKSDTPTIKKYAITPELFEEELKYLMKNGYTTITLDQVSEELKKGRVPFGQKPVVLTFDDGWKNQYKYAFPLLKKYGMTGIFYIYTDSIDKSNFLSKSEIKEMQDAGEIFESHSVSHPYFKSLSLNEVRSEITNSKKILESVLNKPVLHFASPYGYSNPDIISLAHTAGYHTFRTTYKGVYQDNPLRLRGILATDSFDYFIQELAR